MLARRALDPWLAIPFGIGVALTLDESALLLELDDVYWTEEGIVTVQITLAAGLDAARPLALALRILRRGEREVLDGRLARRSGRGGVAALAPASVQMTWSRPGPTPTSAIGTPMNSAM